MRRLYYKDGKPRSAKQLINDILWAYDVPVLERGSYDHFLDVIIRYDEEGEIVPNGVRILNKKGTRFILKGEKEIKNA